MNATSTDQDAALRALYIQGLRQRFKDEVNRLTSGAMRTLLEPRPEAAQLAFLFSYLYAWCWLRDQVGEAYRGELLAAFKGSSRAFLMELLEHSDSLQAFVQAYIHHWQQQPLENQPVQGRELRQLLHQFGGERALLNHILDTWRELGLFQSSSKEIYASLAKRERNRYRDMLSPADRERLALIDQLPDAPGAAPWFEKLGLIPAMGCPQTCRHCMFIWRPPVKDAGRRSELYELVDGYTRNVLFTGGDLTRHLHHFYDAIGQMRHIETFAILLNGDFATDRQTTRSVLEAMNRAIGARPAHWARARVLLQISFDEFHQEVMLDKKGRLRERIPVAKIANIVEAASRYEHIQLALLHKQNRLNFSMQLFEKGVFGRLARELGQRGHRIEVISAAPADRHKTVPGQPGQKGQVVKDASFILSRYPQQPILLTSSTIDAFGRAETIEPGEAVQERDYLHSVLRRSQSPGEGFDTDLMFWFNGWVTLFSAVHLCLGNLFEDGAEQIFARQRKDPLLEALKNFDTRLLVYYQEVADDLEHCIAQASSPHQLFHRLTEQSQVRLHFTKRLLQEGVK